MPQLSLMGKDFLLKMPVIGGKAKLFDLSQTDSAIDVTDEHPQKLQNMQELTHAIYQSTKYLLYHNPSLSQD